MVEDCLSGHTEEAFSLFVAREWLNGTGLVLLFRTGFVLYSGPSARNYSKMLTLSRKTDYAFVAIAALARQFGTCVSSTRLAETIEAPEALLRNILKDLARAGLLEAERGPHGGYVFSRDPGSVDLLKIVETIEGPIAVVRCCSPEETEEDGCTHSPRCKIQHAMREMHEGVLNVLRRMSVADLIAEPDGVEAGVPLSVMGERSVTNESAGASQRTYTMVDEAAGRVREHATHTTTGEVE